jgi:pimeloyl-ACP methyl ester carboxylesterase
MEPLRFLAHPVAMFGHSLGGSVAAEATLTFPIVHAGVDVDGTPRGNVLEAGLDKPFGVMLSNPRVVDNLDDEMES